MRVKRRTISPLPPETESAPREEVLSLFLALSPADQDWLTQQLARLDPWEDDEARLRFLRNDTRTEKDDELPEIATFEEAIDLFLADKCSLGRAAELAGVTRWDIQDVLYERRTPVQIYSGKSVEEMDDLADRLESRGLFHHKRSLARWPLLMLYTSSRASFPKL